MASRPLVPSASPLPSSRNPSPARSTTAAQLTSAPKATQIGPSSLKPTHLASRCDERGAVTRPKHRAAQAPVVNQNVVVN